MPNTYSQIYIQIIFAVRGRERSILEDKRNELEKFITGIVKNRNQKLLSIYINPDHAHILIGLNNLDMKIPDLVRDIKAGSSKMMNDNNWFSGKFCWQEGYGAFSYSKSQIDKVVKYIMNQPEHHKKTTFKDQYLKILNDLGIVYEEKYLFEFYGEYGD